MQSTTHTVLKAYQHSTHAAFPPACRADRASAYSFILRHNLRALALHVAFSLLVPSVQGLLAVAVIAVSIYYLVTLYDSAFLPAFGGFAAPDENLIFVLGVAALKGADVASTHGEC